MINMLKRFYSFALVLLASLMTAWATDVTVSPTLDVNFRTAAGNTAWQTVKNAADDGNGDFELTYTAGFFALQKYTVEGLQNASKLVLTLTVGTKSGVDAVKLWAFTKNDWTADTGVDDIVPLVKAQTGIDPRATEGTANTPLVSGSKVSGSNPAKATFTITGTALATIKANASADGTFTLLLTNDNLTNTNNKRSYQSNNSANDEANRPSLTATIETPSVVNKTTGAGYANLTDAFNAAVAADADAELEVYEDQKLSSRLTLNKAHAITITPMKDITIKGAPGMMWFLVNVSNGVFNIGSTDHKITLDGEGKTMTIDAAVIQRENGGMMNVTNVEFKDFDLGETARLLGDKQQGGVMTLDGITVTNCTNPKGGYIYALRVANDALVLKGYVNIDNASTGTAIYKQANTSGSSTEGRLKVDDANFTASKQLTIKWTGLDGKDVFIEGASVVVGVTSNDIAQCFTLTGTDWTLTRVNNDLKLAAPVTPTAQIGENKYADLVAALAVVQDGETITLLDDQELKARVNVKNMSITVDGAGKTIRRATDYADGLLFLTQKADEEKTTALTLQNVTIDGQNVETTAAVIEASNNATTTLKDVTIQNVVTTAAGSIVNKSGGKLVLAGNIVLPSLFVGNGVVADATEAVIATPIALTTDANRPYGIFIEGGKADNFVCTSFRLSQQQDGVYNMPLPQELTVSHPALLHTSANIEAVKTRLESEQLAKDAYARLEAQSAGTASGAVEYLKRMDKANWESTYSDYSNFTRAATDAKLAYELALRYQLKNSSAAADAAVKILNAWASTCTKITANDNNQYLLAGFQGNTFANAAELLRSYSGWSTADQTKFKSWIKSVWYEKNYWFIENHGGTGVCDLHYWSNWELCNLASILSIGIYLEDADMVNYVNKQFLSGKGSGALKNMVPYDPVADPSGKGNLIAQSMESGRDQGHATLVCSMAAELCRIAQNVGLDFWGAENNRVLAMFEYTAKYNVKPDGSYIATSMPFTEYKYCTGCSCSNKSHGAVHKAVSSDSRGTIRPCWELIYAHYAKEKAMAANNVYYTKLFADQLRISGGVLTGDGGAGDSRYGSASGAFDQIGWGTLLFYQGE